jgi:hypothetical protein
MGKFGEMQKKKPKTGKRQSPFKEASWQAVQSFNAFDEMLKAVAAVRVETGKRRKRR